MDQLQILFKKYAEKKIFIFPDKKNISYKEIFQRSLNLANSLIEKYKKIKGKIIFLKVLRSSDYYTAIIGLTFLETTIIPISQKISRNELSYLRKKYKPYLEIDEIKSLLEVKKFRKKIKFKKNLLRKSKIVFFTSGTTGKPKGIVHNIFNLLKSANDFSTLANYRNGSRILHNWPHYYMAGFFNMFLCPLVSGSTIFFDEEIDINTYLNYWQKLKENKIDIAYLSPTMAHALISYSNYKKIDNKNIKTKIISTGSFLYSSTKLKFKNIFGIDLINCYGVTEVGGSISLSNKLNQKAESIGKLSDGVKIKLSKNNEIQIKSKYQFEGYLENYLNFKKFKNAYFNSGDLGKFEKGEFIITGRDKEIIKKGGEAVSLLKIEDIALGCKGVKM